MFKHIFKLIWNKRKQNFLFLSEILVSFMVIFALASVMVFYYINYKKPYGINYKRVWAVTFSNPSKTENVDSLELFYKNLRLTVMSLPQVVELSYTTPNFPFANSMSTTGAFYNGKSILPVNRFEVGESYEQVMGMKLLEGRWFDKNKDLPSHNQLVINASLKKALFGNGSALGKRLGSADDKNKSEIIGVVADVKGEGDYMPAGMGMYKALDTGGYRWIGNMLIKVRSGSDAAFESRLNKLLSRTIKNSSLEIQHLEDMRISKNKVTLIPMIICLTVASFLIINVALGLFGVLWYNISRRRSEIGLRRAIGASGRAVSAQLVYESLMLASLSIVAGTFFAVQFPLLHVFNVPALVYLIALLLTILFIYLLVIVCSLYPGRQAARIQPAIALHEE